MTWSPGKSKKEGQDEGQGRELLLGAWPSSWLSFWPIPGLRVNPDYNMCFKEIEMLNTTTTNATVLIATAGASLLMLVCHCR